MPKLVCQKPVALDPPMVGTEFRSAKVSRGQKTLEYVRKRSQNPENVRNFKKRSNVFPQPPPQQPIHATANGITVATAADEATTPPKGKTTKMRF